MNTGKTPFAQRLTAQARALYLGEDLGLEKAAVKIHTSLDLRGNIFERLHTLRLAGAFFITRAPSNLSAHTLFEKMPVQQALAGIECSPEERTECNPLQLFYGARSLIHEGGRQEFEIG